jgi:hypothetical protein
MNQNTWISWITTGVGLFGAVAADRGLIDSSTVTSVAGAAAVLVPLAWGLFIHRDSKVVQTASVVPGIETIRVSPGADPALQALADDKSVPTVQPAVQPSPAPSALSAAKQRGF